MSIADSTDHASFTEAVRTWADRAGPTAAVRDALDEEMRSRPTTIWQAFWDGFKRA